MKARVVVWCVLLMAVTGCWGRKLTWQEKKTSSAGIERMQAVMMVGEERSWSDIPYVITRLDDDDESVRLMSARVLQDMTGENFGYKAYAPEHERREAAKRWRHWWNTTGRKGPRAARVKAGGQS